MGNAASGRIVAEFSYRENGTIAISMSDMLDVIHLL